MIFSFASDNTIAIVLLQRNEQGYEQPISFFSKTLRDSELKYDLIEKQAYALVKDLNSFRVYVLQSKITAYVPSSAVKEILVQPDCEGKRGKWITKILEYDLTIKPTQLIKGQGLAKLMTESNCKAVGLYHLLDIIHDSPIQIEEINLQINRKYVSSKWYKDIVFFLLNFQSPPELDKSKFRSLNLRAVKYCIVDQTLFLKDPNGFLLRCVDEKKLNKYFMICIMVSAEAIIIGILLPSRFLEQDITHRFYSQIFLLRSGHVNLVRNLLERRNLYLCL
jgi:hypothetical protein